jgi:hypothetical protein
MTRAGHPDHDGQNAAKSGRGSAAELDDLPAGDLPPQPRWPLVLASAAWGLWVVFLVAMMWMRIRTTAV